MELQRTIVALLIIAWSAQTSSGGKVRQHSPFEAYFPLDSVVAWFEGQPAPTPKGDDDPSSAHLQCHACGITASLWIVGFISMVTRAASMAHPPNTSILPPSNLLCTPHRRAYDQALTCCFPLVSCAQPCQTMIASRAPSHFMVSCRMLNRHSPHRHSSRRGEMPSPSSVGILEKKRPY